MQQVLITIVWICFLLATDSRADTSWKKKIDRAGIQVYQQHRHPKYRLQHTKGVIIVPATPAMVFSLLDDVQNFPQWIFACLDAERKPDGLLHLSFEGPLWFSDRDLVFNSEVTYLSSHQQWQIYLSNQPHKYSSQDFIRIQQFEASWLLTMLADNKLQVTYEVYMDPEINFKSGINKYNRDFMFNTLRNMRIILQQSPYKDQQSLPQSIKDLKVDQPKL